MTTTRLDLHSTLTPTPPQTSPRVPYPLRVLATVLAMAAAVSVPLLVLAVPGLSTVLTGVSAQRAQLVALPLRLLTGLAYLGVAWVLVHGLDRRRLADCGLVWTRASAAWLTLGLTTAVAVVLGLAATLTAHGAVAAVPPAHSGLVSLVAAVLGRAFLLQGFGEELLFRGYLLQTLRRRPLLAVAVSTVVFTALHLLSNGGQQGLTERLIYLAMPFGFGLAGAGLALYTRSLWGAIGVHAGFHVANIIGAELGLGDGPAVWASSGAVFALLGVAALALWWRRGHRRVVLDR